MVSQELGIIAIESLSVTILRVDLAHAEQVDLHDVANVDGVDPLILVQISHERSHIHSISVLFSHYLILGKINQSLLIHVKATGLLLHLYICFLDKLNVLLLHHFFSSLNLTRRIQLRELLWAHYV